MIKEAGMFYKMELERVKGVELMGELPQEQEKETARPFDGEYKMGVPRHLNVGHWWASSCARPI